MPLGNVSIGNVIGASAETGSFGGYNVTNYAGFGAGTYNSLSAYYGYGYNNYISGIAGTSPFFGSFLASTGYGGGPANVGDLGGNNITGNFGAPEFALLSDPLIFDPNLPMPTGKGFVFDASEVYLDALALGFPQASARAIAGVSFHESAGGNPSQWELSGDVWTRNPANRPGYGIFQFTDTPSVPLLSLFELYTEDMGYSRSDVWPQMTFAMAMAYPSLLNYLMNPNITQEQAAQAWAMGFEQGQPTWSTIWSSSLPDYNSGKGWVPPVPARFSGPMDDLWLFD